MDQSNVLPIVIDGFTRYISGVTQETTCDDVLQMVTSLPGVDKNSIHTLALFESSYGVDRMLPGNTNILNVWLSWLETSRNFAIVLRKADPIPKVSYAKRKVLHQKSKIQRMRPYRFASSNLRNILYSLPKLQGGVHNKNLTVSKDQLNYIKDMYLSDLPQDELEFHLEKPVTQANSRTRSAQKSSISKLSSTRIDEDKKFARRTSLSGLSSNPGRRLTCQSVPSKCNYGVNATDDAKCGIVPLIGEGKKAILQRYFEQYELHMPAKSNDCRRRLDFSLDIRTPGDGAEAPLPVERKVDGAEDVFVSLWSSNQQSQPDLLNSAFVVPGHDSSDDDSLVSSSVEFQDRKCAVVKRQNRLMDCVFVRPAVECDTAEDEDNFSEDACDWQNRIPISSFSSIHEQIESLLNNCLLLSEPEFEGSSSSSDDLSV